MKKETAGAQVDKSISSESASRDKFDFFIGRTILGSEDVVRGIRRIDSRAEILASSGLLVMPLMQRHILEDLSEAQVQALVDELLTSSTPTVPGGVSAQTGTPFWGARKRDGRMQHVVYLPFLTDGARTYDAQRYSKDQKAVSSVIRKKADTTSFKIRIAESPFLSVAEDVIELLEDCDLARSAIDLSPPQVCRAPKKSHNL